MISESPVVTIPETEPKPVPPTFAAIRERLAALGSEAVPGSQDHEAAIILLAAEAIGQNIDRLARFTGIPREKIARSARRLVDNGVWHEGDTVSPWVDTPSDSASFWSDVAVANGGLCRRMGEDGMPEWAPQGYWRKHYEYVGPRDEARTQETCYHPHVEQLSQDIPYVAVDEEEETPPEAPARREGPASEHRDHRPTVNATLAKPQPDNAPVWLGGKEAAASDDDTVATSSESIGASLFPEAVWLG